jgi:peptidoglycan/LPS O-acetylase OafA/YrhL
VGLASQGFVPLPSAAIGNERHAHFDGVRGMAAFVVLIYHHIYAFAYALIDSDPANPWIRAVSSSPLAAFYNGTFCVWVFFVLSGLVLSAGMYHSRSSWPAIVVKRYVRLTLPILATSFLALLAVRLHANWNNEVAALLPKNPNNYPVGFSPGILDWLSDSLYGTYLTGHSPFNSVLWSMKVELFGSLLVYLVWRVCPVRVWRMILCLLLSLGFFLLLKKHSSFQGLQLFPIGILIFDLLIGSHKPSRRVNWNPWIGTLVLLIGLSLGGWLVKAPSLPGAYLLFTVILDRIVNVKTFTAEEIGAVLVVAAVAFTPFFHRPLSRGLFQWLGAISLPLYLIHPLVIVTVACGVFFGLESSAGYAIAAALGAASSIAISLMLAAILTPIVERNAIGLSRRAAAYVDSKWRSLGGWAAGKSDPARDVS